MSQSAPRRTAHEAERRQSNSPAQELKRKMATVTVRVEKDEAIDRRSEANGDREAKDKLPDGQNKAEAKQTAADTNGKPAATESAAQSGARPEGSDIPPNIKQSKVQEGDKAVSAKSDKDAKKEDKHSNKKAEKDSKKEDKKTTEKIEKDASKKDEKKEDSDTKTEDKGGSKLEEKRTATNGDDTAPQENGERRKPDTNYSLSRVKISPYRRGRSGDPGDTPGDGSLGDCSTQANYAGNNSTMEADLSVSSRSETPARGAGGLRSLRGRASYRALGELSLSVCSRDSVGARPTAPVVGRKRAAPPASLAATPATHGTHATHGTPAALKRPRLAQIVGINSDLPLCGPAGSELESLKPAGCPSSGSKSSGAGDRRCSIM